MPKRTYLLPLTSDPGALEREAGVPTGTYAALERALQNSPQAGSPEERTYWRRYRGTDVAKLDQFLFRGYGEMSQAARRVLLQRGLNPKSGHTDDPELKRALMGDDAPAELQLQWFTHGL